MSVVIETTIGDFTVDLYVEERPTTCLNFLKLCKVKYYNFCLFNSVQSNFMAQTGDPTGTGNGGESVFGLIKGREARYYSGEKMPIIRHTRPGLLSMVNCGDKMLGCQFLITLGSDLKSLDEHVVFGEVAEGFENLLKLNEAICDESYVPYQDIRITHTVILEDPFDDPEGLYIPDASPEPSREMLMSDRIRADEDIDEEDGLSEEQLREIKAAKEAAAQATLLEIVGDIPDADVAPPENVLFVCKLNPVTTDDDLQIIFGRFGKINSCEIIRDKKSGESLQYAFIEFDEQKSCEEAYFKMDNVLIDDRRIHVDFSQSVSKIKWNGKGKPIEYRNESDSKDGNRKRRMSPNNRGNSSYDETSSERGNSRDQSRHTRDKREGKRNNSRSVRYDSRDSRDNLKRERDDFRDARDSSRYKHDHQDEKRNYSRHQRDDSRQERDDLEGKRADQSRHRYNNEEYRRKANSPKKGVSNQRKYEERSYYSYGNKCRDDDSYSSESGNDSYGKRKVSKYANNVGFDKGKYRNRRVDGGYEENKPKYGKSSDKRRRSESSDSFNENIRRNDESGDSSQENKHRDAPSDVRIKKYKHRDGNLNDEFENNKRGDRRCGENSRKDERRNGGNEIQSSSLREKIKLIISSSSGDSSDSDESIGRNRKIVKKKTKRKRKDSNECEARKKKKVSRKNKRKHRHSSSSTD